MLSQSGTVDDPEHRCQELPCRNNSDNDPNRLNPWNRGRRALAGVLLHENNDDDDADMSQTPRVFESTQGEPQDVGGQGPRRPR